VIRSGTFVTSGEVGIGSTPTGSVLSLEFDGTQNAQVVIDCHSESNWCLNGTVIRATRAWINATTDTASFIDPVWGAGTDFGQFEFLGRYRVPSKKDSFGTSPLLHLGTIAGVTNGVYTLVVSRPGSTNNYKRTMTLSIPEISGAIVSVDYLGDYEAVLVDSTGFNTITLCDGGGSTDRFTVQNGETFVQTVAPCGSAPASESGGLSAGGKAGISIVVILVVVAAAVVVFWFVRKKRSVAGAGEQLTGDQMFTQTQDGGGGYTDQSGGL
jgi:hypothetical protein